MKMQKSHQEKYIERLKKKISFNNNIIVLRNVKNMQNDEPSEISKE